MSKNIDNTVKEGTLFMDLSTLFSVFNVLKCPDCGCDTDSHVDMKKKCGYSNYIVLQCNNMECGWKYSFNFSKKLGLSYKMNVRAVLAFREIGKGHNALTTFNKVMNMPAPLTQRNLTKSRMKRFCQLLKN